MDTYTLFFIILFAIFIVIAISTFFGLNFSKKNPKDIARYVKENTSSNTLGSFICYFSPKVGDVGLFLSTESVKCSNSEQIVFDIPPTDLKRVEYSGGNFFKFYTTDETYYRISWLHDVKDGESLINNIFPAESNPLAYTDPAATQNLLTILDTLNIEYVKRPHIKMLF